MYDDFGIDGLKRKSKNNEGKIIISTKFKELNKVIQKYRRRLVNIYTDYHYKIIKEILDESPKEIHIEDLSINNIKKDKKLSHSIHLSSWYKFFRKLEEKCQRLGIKLLRIDRFFASNNGSFIIELEKYLDWFCNKRIKTHLNYLNRNEYMVNYLK